MFNYGLCLMSPSAVIRGKFIKNQVSVFINSWHTWFNYLSILIRIWKSEPLTQIVNFVNCQVWYKQKSRLNVCEISIDIKSKWRKIILFTRQSFDMETKPFS